MKTPGLQYSINPLFSRSIPLLSKVIADLFRVIDMKMNLHLLSLLIISLPFFLSCSQPHSELKIMTFNIRYGTADDGKNSWNFRKAILIETLKKHRPDILGTQESLDFQIDEIKSAFPNWNVFGVGRYHGIELPNRPHESMSGESCKIFYDSTKFNLIKEGTFWHSDTPDSAGSMSWGNDLPRVTTWGIFQIKTKGKKFVVMNTHYHWGEPYVTNASNLMVAKWHEIADKLPTILMGDFNLPPTSKTHQLFCSKTGQNKTIGNFIDPWNAWGNNEQNAGTYNSFMGDKSGDRIDWILVTPHFKINSIKIIDDEINGSYPSDHFPVETVLKL